MSEEDTEAEDSEETESPKPSKVKAVLERLSAVGARLAPIKNYFFPFTKDHLKKLGIGFAGAVAVVLCLLIWLFFMGDDTIAKRTAKIAHVETTVIKTAAPGKTEQNSLPDIAGHVVSPVQIALKPAPFPWLVEERGNGVSLPTIGPNGEHPWQVYARPFPVEDPRPRIAIVVTGLGLADTPTKKAILELPGEITIGLSPYASQLPFWVEQSRNTGHEVLLTLPMETDNFPHDDPGPKALRPDIKLQANLIQLENLLAAAPGTVGFIVKDGTQTKQNYQRLRAFVETLKRRGIMLYNPDVTEDDRLHHAAEDVGLAYLQDAIRLDNPPAPAHINAQLGRARQQALASGSAIVVTEPYPIALDALIAWIDGLDGTQVTVAPLTALVKSQTE